MPTDPPAPHEEPVGALERRSALLLDESVRALAPLVRMLVDGGVGYPQLAQALKPVFMDAARAQLQAQDARVTDAAVSVRSGVHRKDVRAWSSATAAQASAPAGGGPAGNGPGTAASVSVADQVFTRWCTDAGYREAAGRPAVLPLTGPAPSFDTLVGAVTRDLSRRTVLDELVRLGLAREADGRVEPLAEAAVPSADHAQMLRYLADHLRDHAAAGAANLRAGTRGDRPPFLEHAMYATGLSDASIEQLRLRAVELWKTAFGQIVETARQRHDLDRPRNLAGRVRFGVYFYSEPAGDGSAPGAQHDPQTAGE